MLRWAFAFFVLTFIAALVGFSGLRLASVELARGLFFGFLALFLVTFVSALAGVGRRRSAA